MFKRNKRAKVGAVKTRSVFYKNDENIRASPLIKDEPFEFYFDDTKTLYEIFMRGVRLSGEKPCVGWKLEPDLPYTWITYNDLLYRSKCVGSGLIDLGAKPNPSQFIGILASSRLEWMLVEQACNCYSMVIVPFVASSNEMIEHIMKLCKLKIVIVDTNAKAFTFLTLKTELHIELEVLVIMDEINEKVTELAQTCQVKLFKFSNVEEQGKSKLQDSVPPLPEDLHTIAFTSGTSSFPKALMLTHKNIAVAISSCYRGRFMLNTNFVKSDVYFSFYPLSHPIETLLHSLMFMVGGKTGFFNGLKFSLLNYVRELKPTFIVFPSLLMHKIYKKINFATSKSLLKNWIITSAFKAKMKLLNQEIFTTNTIWDYLVFRKIRNMFGGKIKICFSGGAPMLQEALNFMQCALGVKMIVGYGFIEAVSVISSTLQIDLIQSSVGVPLCSILIKLSDVPHLNYFAKNDIGEICVKGGNLFPGYYKDKALTKAAFDSDGWFHTGDVGTWLDNGSLKFIDRIVDILKLSNGQLVAPEPVEFLFFRIHIIQQIFIYGDSQHDFVIAIIVPDERIFVSWCKSNQIQGDYKTFFDNQKVNSLIFNEIKDFGEANGLKQHEVPKHIYISEEEFSPENGLLTASYKTKRKQIYLSYKKQIKEMLNED